MTAELNEQPNQDDWEPHLRALGEWPVSFDTGPERTAVLRQLQDNFPTVSYLLREAQAEARVTAAFEPGYSPRIFGTVLITAPGCSPFGIAIYLDKLALVGDVILGANERAGADFWIRLSENLAPALITTRGWSK